MCALALNTNESRAQIENFQDFCLKKPFRDKTKAQIHRNND